MPPVTRNNRADAFVVAGMHRSGTSAMARVLSLAGGQLPERLMDPGPDNPLGFWEPWEMVGLNDAILAAVGSRWDDVFGHRVDAAVRDRRAEFDDNARRFVLDNYAGVDLAILKDPRASLMVSFWDAVLRSVASDPLYVVMVRHPLEVAGSIAARDGAAEASSVLAWSAYMLSVERDTRGKRRIFVDYQSLLADWRGILSRIVDALGRPMPDLSESGAAEIDAFLSGAQRHHHCGDDALAGRPDLWPEVGHVYQWLTAAAKGVEPDTGPMDQALAALESLALSAAPALGDLRAEAAGFPAVRRKLEETERENEALRQLANQFHAEADHNGRHWRAAEEQAAHFRHELDLARAEAAAARKEAIRTLPLRRDIAGAEAALLRQLSRNQELLETLERDGRLATAHATHAAGEQARLLGEIEDLSGQIAALGDTLSGTRSELEAAQIRETDRLLELRAAQERETALRLEVEAMTGRARNAERRCEALVEEIQGLVAHRDRLLNSPMRQLTRPIRVVIKRLKALGRPGPAA